MPASSITSTSRDGEQVAALLPAMLHAGDGARRDARSAFEVFRRDAGQCRAPDLVARRFPGLPRHAQHRALARSGMADHDPKIAPVRDMRQRVGLLARKDKAALLRHAPERLRGPRHAPHGAPARPSVRRRGAGAVRPRSCSRVVKRSSPRASLPSSTRSGALRIAPMTSLNWSIPSLCRCANFAMSRRVKVDC